MCYSTSLRKSEDQLSDHQLRDFEVHFEYRPHYFQSGFDHPNLYVITQDEPATIWPAIWGFVPSSAMENIDQFYKDYNTLNARSEDIFESRTYGGAIRNKRCLIIADGFFEPHRVDKGSYPYFCHYVNDRAFCFAGVYSELDDKLFSCSILTTEANPFFEHIHNVKKGMPLVLDTEFEEEWIRSDLSEGKIKELMRFGFTKEEFEAYPVTRKLYSKGFEKNRPLAIERKEHPQGGSQ